MLLKLAALGALGYAGYKVYEKNMGSGQSSARQGAGASTTTGGAGPLREGADTDGAGSSGMVHA